MDLSYSAEYEEFRGEVKAFLARSWPLEGSEAELSRRAQHRLFRQRAIEAGYLGRAIPRRFGGSEQPPDVFKAAIIEEELSHAGAPGEIGGGGMGMLVPTLLEHASEELSRRFIPPTLLGDLHWCQGYSEPGAGSDLASLKTRAELVGDEWVINGQKIWTSGAREAGYMFCLCRTEPDAPKHAGISYLLIPMEQPGIEVRPLKQMTGDADFNEVFFSDARAPAANIVGKRGEGWLVARTTLKHERNMIGNAVAIRRLFDSLVRLARERQLSGDPHIRQQLGELEGHVAAQEYSFYRQMTCAARGENPGPVVFMNKLNSTTLTLRISRLALDLLGEEGLAAPSTNETIMSDAPKGPGGWVSHGMWALGLHIGGGTANVQRNIIGERTLGLPRDRAAQRR